LIARIVVDDVMAAGAMHHVHAAGNTVRLGPHTAAQAGGHGAAVCQRSVYVYLPHMGH
jgi:hypothetical protein